MEESHNPNIEQEEEDTRECLQYDSTYIKLNRQK